MDFQVEQRLFISCPPESSCCVFVFFASSFLEQVKVTTHFVQYLPSAVILSRIKSQAKYEICWIKIDIYI